MAVNRKNALWKLTIEFTPYPLLRFSGPPNLDGGKPQEAILRFRMFKPRVSTHDLISLNEPKDVDTAIHCATSYEKASRQKVFQIIGVPIIEFFTFNFEEFKSVPNSNHEILVDICKKAGIQYEVLYPDIVTEEKRLHHNRIHRLFPIFLLPEYLSRLPFGMLMASRVVVSDTIDKTINQLEQAGNSDKEQANHILYNKLALQFGLKRYYRTIEEHQSDYINVANLCYQNNAIILALQSKVLEQEQIIKGLMRMSERENEDIQDVLKEEAMALD